MKRFPACRRRLFASVCVDLNVRECVAGGCSGHRPRRPPQQFELCVWPQRLLPLLQLQLTQRLTLPWPVLGVG